MPTDRAVAYHSIHLMNSKQLNQVAKQHFLYEGITFTVYGEDEGIERTISDHLSHV